jgi:hypothetical protein
VSASPWVSLRLFACNNYRTAERIFMAFYEYIRSSARNMPEYRTGTSICFWILNRHLPVRTICIYLFPIFLTVYPCFAFKKYTGTFNFPFRAPIKSFTKMYRHISVLVKIGQHCSETYVRFCTQKWLDGGLLALWIPSQTGYHAATLGNPRGNVITKFHIPPTQSTLIHDNSHVTGAKIKGHVLM